MDNVGKIKSRLIKIQEKIQDRMEDLQDQVQNKYERSKISKFISHLSDDKSSLEGESNDERPTDGDTTSIDSGKSTDNKSCLHSSIPSVVIDEPTHETAQDICKNFLHIERNGVFCQRRCLSTSNLNTGDGLSIDSSTGSSDSCMSCLSSSDERFPEPKLRAGSLPPECHLEHNPTINTCTEIIERIGNRFPGLKSSGDKIQRVFVENCFWWWS